MDLASFFNQNTLFNIKNVQIFQSLFCQMCFCNEFTKVCTHQSFPLYGIVYVISQHNYIIKNFGFLGYIVAALAVSQVVPHIYNIRMRKRLCKSEPENHKSFLKFFSSSKHAKHHKNFHMNYYGNQCPRSVISYVYTCIHSGFQHQLLGF